MFQIIIGIIAYVLLTTIAIYFAKDEGILDENTHTVILFVRIMFILLIGWLVALLMGTGMIVAGIGLRIGEQTIGYRAKGGFCIIDWVGREIKILAFLIIPRRRKKKEEAETCPTKSQIDSRNEPKES